MSAFLHDGVESATSSRCGARSAAGSSGEDSPALLVGGGSGVVPLMAMLRARATGRPISCASSCRCGRRRTCTTPTRCPGPRSASSTPGRAARRGAPPGRLTLADLGHVATASPPTCAVRPGSPTRRAPGGRGGGPGRAGPGGALRPHRLTSRPLLPPCYPYGAPRLAPWTTRSTHCPQHPQRHRGRRAVGRGPTPGRPVPPRQQPVAGHDRDPPDRAAHGAFHMFRDQAELDVRAIAEEAAAGDAPAAATSARSATSGPRSWTSTPPRPPTPNRWPTTWPPSERARPRRAGGPARAPPALRHAGPDRPVRRQRRRGRHPRHRQPRAVGPRPTRRGVLPRGRLRRDPAAYVEHVATMLRLVDDQDPDGPPPG